MKVLAFNSSPRMDKGSTSIILTPFLDGMREAGAEVELFYTSKLNINPCKGDFSCWINTPGKCIQNDDMSMLIPKLSEAHIWVFATPVYVDGITGPLKNLIDRLIPLVEPFFELRDGHCRHPSRQSIKNGKLVLVSNCGFWETDNFEPLITHMKAASKNMSREYAGALLRPHGPALRTMLKMGLPVYDVLEAAKEAGRQLIKDGKMKTETLATVSRELAPLKDYMQIQNTGFQRALDRLKL